MSAPDPRLKATEQPGHTAIPYMLSNTELGKALDANIRALHGSGEIARILEAHGLDRQAAEVGASRLVD